MEQTIKNITELIKSNNCIYVSIIITILFLAFFISLSNNQRDAFKLILTRLPILSFILIILFIISLYNLFAAIILLGSLVLVFIIPTTTFTITESFKDTVENDDTSNGLEDNDDSEKDDDYNYDKSKKELNNTVKGKEDHQYNNSAGNNRAHVKSHNPNLDNELLNNPNSNSIKSTTLEIPSPIVPNKNKEPVKNYLSKSLNLYNNKYADKFNEALIENKNAIQKRMKTVMKNNSKHSSNREDYSDVYDDNDNDNNYEVSSGGSPSANNNARNYKFNNSNSNIKKKASKSQGDLTIMKRKFNINDETDKNLLNTREICTDIINRINYEYEDGDYLRKYIGSRVEEIIEINKLLDED